MNSRWRGFEVGAVDGVLLVVVLASVGWLGVAERTSRQAEQAWRLLESDSRHLRSAMVASPLPPATDTRREIETLGTRVMRWENSLGRDARALRQQGALEAADAYFALARQGEEMRRQLIKAGVATRDTERFGFASYRFAGPPAELVRIITRQQGRVACVMEAVAQARAHGLVRVEREAPSAERAEPMEAGDFFVPESGLKLPLSAEAEQSLFRITFVGETSALRAFLDQLGDRAPDGFVRWVEVRPWSADSPEPATLPESKATALQFAVTIAFLEWPEPGPGKAEEGS